MRVVGTVAQLWRYPVKSLQGEQVESLEITSDGAVGDRTLAVVDPKARKVLSAKRHAALLMASARRDSDGDGGVIITLPDGSEHSAADPVVHDALSAWLGIDVRLEPPPTDGVFPMEMYSGMSDEDTPLFEWPGPEGRWVDLADVHWLTTASLAAIAGRHPDGQWDVRRFRPTALIESTDEGYPEDDWGLVQVGEVAAEVLMATPRCTMPSREQPGLARDKAIGTTIRDHHANNLGVYATIRRGGTVRIGDPVHAT